MTGGGALAGRVRAIWSEMLGDTDPDVGFLGSGGHSLLAARLIARIAADLGADLSLATFLRDDPSLTELVGLVERAEKTPTPLPDPGAGRADAAQHGGSAPISPAMRRIWTWHRLHPGSPAYNVVRVLAVEGRVQPAALRAALADLADRHAALRCRVAEPAPARPEIVVGGERVPVPLVTEVVRGEAGPGLDAPVEAALRGVADRPIPMDTAPLWRCGLVWSPGSGRSFVALVMHHIISDLRSSDIVLADLATAYAARSGGSAPDWPDPAPDLLDHLHHQGALTGSARWRADLDWWGDRLAGHVHPQVPTQPAVTVAPDEHRADTVSVDMAPAATGAVEALSRRAGITPAVLFLTAATAVLAARSGGDPGVVGVPGVRLARPGDERTVTFLLDTLLLVTGDPAAGERTVLDACAATRLALVDAVDHATPAFDEVLDRMRLSRTARSPLVRLWFNDLTGAAPPARFGGHPAAEHDLPPGWALFDLGLYVWRTATGYRVHAVAPRGRTRADDLAAFARQVVEVCAAAAADPHRRLADALPAAALPPTAGPGHVVPTTDVLARSAGEQPAAAALATADGLVDRRTLDAAVTTLAEQVRALVGPRGVVALPARRDRRFVERLLACLRAGATPVLIDATWPRGRRDGAVRAARARHAFPDGDGLPVPTGVPTDDASDDVVPAGSPEPVGGAHVLFTSGTTAEPLPVLVPTAVTDAAVAELGEWFGITAADRVALLSGPAHDPALRDIGLAVRAGACLCLPPPAESADVTGLAGWLRRERITVLSATPALLALVLGADAGPLPELRLVVCGGSPLSTATAELIRSRAPRAVVVNGYGCVETPQLVIAHRLDPGDPLPPTQQVPIGAPLPGRRVELLAPDGRACADGETGEIGVGEPWIAAGYLTAGPDRFVGAHGSARRLRTGDLARRDPAGLLHLVGRADRQVSVNSHRVLLDEVESAARGCPGVADAVAELVGDEQHQGLRLWVQPVGPAPRPDEVSVRRHLAGVLAPQAVPARILVVDRLGLSGNLKPTVPTAPALPPLQPAPVDARLAETAASVLGGPVGATTNFFDAGFSSLTLLQFGAELSTVLGRPIEPLRLFQHPNLRALGTALGLDTPPSDHSPTPSTTGARTAPPQPRRRPGDHARLRDSRRRARERVRESLSDATD